VSQAGPLLPAVVAVAAAWAAAGLALQGARARAFGKVHYHSAPAGDPARGVAYALGPGLSPFAKESTRRHPGAYLAGVGYHLGVFASLALLAGRLAGFVPTGPALVAARALCLLGALCGAGLLVRRLAVRNLRALSCPDDWVAGLLTTGLPALSFAATLAPAAVPWLLAESAALLAYVPLGKIRHCFFFFTTRYHMGYFFGRRGILPPVAGSRG
jgi:hypothetical protein